MAYKTVRELMDELECYTASLQDQLNTSSNYSDLLASIPFMVVIARPSKLEIIGISGRHEQWTGYCEEEIRADCPGYLNNTIHPISLKNIQSFLPEFYRSSDAHRTMTFAQYARYRRKSEYRPLLTFATALTRPDDIAARIIVPPNELETLSRSLEQVVEMDRFKMRNFKRFQQLSPREVQILQLLANGHNNPDIADRCNISRLTVETHRKRLKAKLGIGSYRDVMRYALSFDLLQF